MVTGRARPLALHVVVDFWRSAMARVAAARASASAAACRAEGGWRRRATEGPAVSVAIIERPTARTPTSCVPRIEAPFEQADQPANNPITQSTWSTRSTSRFLVTGRDGRLDPPARSELSDHRHPSRRADADEVVENLVCHALVEDAFVAELEEIVIQCLQLDAGRVWHLPDMDRAEIGQPGLGTHRRELRAVDGDLEGAAGSGIGKVSMVALDMAEKRIAL